MSSASKAKQVVKLYYGILSSLYGTEKIAKSCHCWILRRHNAYENSVLYQTNSNPASSPHTFVYNSGPSNGLSGAQCHVVTLSFTGPIVIEEGTSYSKNLSVYILGFLYSGTLKSTQAPPTKPSTLSTLTD